MLRSEKITNILNFTENQNVKKVPVSVYFTIGIVEFMLSSIFYAYSAFFLEFLDDEFYSYYEGFGVIIFFVSVKSISGSLTKCICDYYEKKILSRVFIISNTIILGLSLLSSSFVEGYEYHLVLYGIIPAFITGCLSTYIKHIKEEEYDFDPNLYDSILLVAKSLSLFTMPVCLIFTSNFYGTFRAILIFSAFILNVIPFSLFLKTRIKDSGRVNNNYFTLKSPEIMTEMTVISETVNEVLEIDSSSSEDGLNEVCDEETLDEVLDNKNITLLNPIQDYYSKIFGVNILPRIREESECSSLNNEISTKRLSQITAKLEEINKNEPKNNQEIPKIHLTEYQEPQNILPYYSNEIMFLQDNSGCCTPYESYLWKRRYRIILRFFTNNFLTPMFKSVLNPKFYPPLFTKVLTTFLTSWFIISAPYMAMIKSEILNKKFTTLDSIFVSSYIAFAWVFFLMSLPAIIRQSHLRTKVIYILGTAKLALAMLFSTKRLTNDAITLSCLFFGFGYGMTSYSENIVFKDFLGSNHWQDCKGCLETFTGIFIIILYYILKFYNVNYESIILYSFLVYFVNICLWILAPILKIAVKYIKRSFVYRQQENLF